MPHSLAVLASQLYISDPESSRAKAELQEQLATARKREGRCLILVPVQAGGPDHWTALTLLRPAGSHSQFEVHYEDSLSQEHIDCRLQAETLLGCLTHLEVPVSKRLPQTEFSVRQKDGYSCGYHVLNRFEEQYRQLRGEGRNRIYTKIEQRRLSVNRFVQSVLETMKPIVESQPAPQPGASSNKPAEPLPLPPPPLAASETSTFGCSRCRWAMTGCLQCNPEKTVRALHRQASK